MSKSVFNFDYDFVVYDAIMSILDAHAQYGKPMSTRIRVALNLLQIELDGDNGEPIEDMIAATADANDCGNCTTWDEMVKELRHNMLTGERIRHNKWTNESSRIDVYDWETGRKLEPIEDGGDN